MSSTAADEPSYDTFFRAYGKKLTGEILTNGLAENLARVEVSRPLPDVAEPGSSTSPTHGRTQNVAAFGVPRSGVLFGWSS